MTRKGRRAVALIAATLLSMGFGSAAQAKTPWLHVSGNRIVDPIGAPVTLRGVSIIAPEQVDECHTCDPKTIPALIDMTRDADQGWYARVVRVPITTKYATEPAILFAKYIDPAVQRAAADGLYVIIDLHYVSNYDAHGSGGIKQSYLVDFWRYVASRYANTPNVIFELFNEPIKPDDWQSWKAYIQPVIEAVRAAAPRNLILVGGPNWSTQVNEAAASPLNGTNLVYVAHIYPNLGPATATNLDARFGRAAQRIPVMLTEFGWDPKGNEVTAGTTSGWGAPFRRYVDAHPEISWTNWIFDNFWKPRFFDNDWKLLGGENEGEFIRRWLADKRASDQPH